MNDRDTNDPLGDTLREHFAAELDGHVGRAAERFNRALGPADAQQAPASSGIFVLTAVSAVSSRTENAAGTAATTQKFPDSARPARAFQLWWSAPILAAAAAIALVVGPHIQLRDAPAPTVGHGPVAVAPSKGATDAQPQLASFDPQDLQGSVTWSTQDDGQVWFDDQTTARRMRTRQLQTIQWTDPADSSRIEITVPREEVVFVSSPKF